jgi:hypothetical protein
MKEKANKGATGENAILYNVKKVDVIVGSMGIVIPNYMMGEITPKIAEAIASCRAKKILIPLIDNEDITVLGIEKKPLFLAIKEAIEKNKRTFRNGKMRPHIRGLFYNFERGYETC